MDNQKEEVKWIFDKGIGACVVTFRRGEHSNLEEGIAILEDTGTYDVKHIVDMDGKIVESIWDYNLRQYEGCFRFNTWKRDE